MLDGHRCVGYDVNADVVSALERDGMVGARSLGEFAEQLEKPRTAWINAGAITEKTIRRVAEVFEAGDVTSTEATPTTTTTSAAPASSESAGSTTPTAG